LANILHEVLADIGEFLAIDTDHAKFIDLQESIAQGNDPRKYSNTVTLPLCRRSKSVKPTTLMP
jgi:hypothetical protein